MTARGSADLALTVAYRNLVELDADNAAIYSKLGDTITFRIGADNFPDRYKWKQAMRDYSEGRHPLRGFQAAIQRPVAVRAHISAYTVREVQSGDSTCFHYSPESLRVIQRLVHGFARANVWLRVLCPREATPEYSQYLLDAQSLSLHVEIIQPQTPNAIVLPYRSYFHCFRRSA
jgi:hypothetical protein